MPIKMTKKMILKMTMAVMTIRMRIEKMMKRMAMLVRLERCIVTIALLDQWLATIENHCHQWLTGQKTIEKPLVPMVEQLPFHIWQ